ncbi:unnamed protein product [Caenorhabditis auriculariae]|uniref:NAD(+) kinase n=1 Tax=Caenorhabditis auriculariae TaxID=2777116 RepID=A0A8S1HTR3_9PELO|nr:unnamed protein product [Caenorhabditis auriculariae]
MPLFGSSLVVSMIENWEKWLRLPFRRSRRFVRRVPSSNFLASEDGLSFFGRRKKTGKSDVELKKYLSSTGSNTAEILENEKKQVDAVTEIVARLHEENITTKVVMQNELSDALPADIIISAGGDGTFLAAASAVKDDTPVIGVNTDPVGSEGHLCVGGKNPPRDLISQLVDGKLKWIRRSRIRVTVKDPKNRFFHSKKTTTNLALNEVFVGENEAAKVSTYNISIDDQNMVKQKSSGLIVTTGTGSTSWYLGMNRVEEATVTSLIEVLQGMGMEVPNSRSIVSEVVNRYNGKIPFEPDHPNFAFSIREPIFNATFNRTATRGYARKIRLESRCSDGFLVLDGATKIPFPRGATATLEISAGDSLLTIT